MSVSACRFCIAYPETDRPVRDLFESDHRGALLLSSDFSLVVKNGKDKSSLNVCPSPSSATTALMRWEGISSYVRLYLDLAALKGFGSKSYTLDCEIELSLVPVDKPVFCEWLAILRRDENGALVFHRKIHDKLKFVAGETRQSWTLTLTREELVQDGGLLLALHLPETTAHFQLEHFGIRVNSLETREAAVTTSIAGLLEGWTRVDDATLRLVSPYNQSGWGEALPLPFGRFLKPITVEKEAQDGAGQAALIVSGEDILAYADLSRMSPARRFTVPDDAIPTDGNISPLMAEWLHERGKVELLWMLGDEADRFGLSDSAQHAFALYGSRAMLDINAVESAYQGLRDAISASHFEALPQVIRRKTRLSFIRACVRSGRSREAEAALQKMVLADPLDWECYFQLGTTVVDAATAQRLTYLKIAASLNPKLPVAMLTAVIEAMLARGQVDDAWIWALKELKARGARGRELWLTLGNIHLARGDLPGWSASLRRVFAEMELAEPDFHIARDPAEDVFHRLEVAGDLPPPTHPQDDLITVIMTTYNAERTVKKAVRSVLAQSYANLRLVVVDDCSTDDTLPLLRQLQTQDVRIEILQTPCNVGTYCAKNMALQRFKSDYFTFHDSDDWMHPERLAIHHAFMKDAPQLLCTTSRWYRMDARGVVIPRQGGGYLHDNPGSAFFHSSVIERVGYFDSVRVGADTEFAGRIRRCFGSDSVKIIAKPLAIGLHHSLSLTRSGVAAFDEYRYSAVRLAYWESWIGWQRRAAVRATDLDDFYVPFPHHPRSFHAPSEIVPENIGQLEPAVRRTQKGHSAMPQPTVAPVASEKTEAAADIPKTEISMTDATETEEQRKQAAIDALMLEVGEWYRGKEFTTDWMSKKVPRWHRFLQSMRDKPVDILEVGSFEGRSAVFLLNYLPLSQLTCIDFFKGPLEPRFDANLAEFGSRLTKLKGSAISHIDVLAQGEAKFDLIYLDAGKQRDHVLALSLLAWPLLKKRGILIWDDYDWGLDKPVDQRPHDGIDIFLNIHEGEYKPLWKQGQVFIQKTAASTPLPGSSPLNPNLSY